MRQGQIVWTSPVYPRFAGKWVLVTGAGTGFGSTIAERVAAEGGNVLVHYHSSLDGAERTAAAVRSYGREAIVLRANLRNWDEIRALAEDAFTQSPGVDALINNVGDIATEQKSWLDIDESIVSRVLDVDIKGTMLMIHEFGIRMLARGSGSIVNIGSTVVVRGSPRAPQYAAGKYGMIGLTKSYAAALAPVVRVNAFAPGFMQTEGTLARDDWNHGRREKLIAMTPLGRIPAPEELAAPALFLATEEAAHMTGAYMLCDGGYSMIGA
jgi:3-oxoacyl-[acyl-carrier protein] reductase